MKTIYSFFLLFIPCMLFAQFSIVSTEPANNAKNVPLTTTISLTFNEAIDTNSMSQSDSWFSNIDSIVTHGYSLDGKTASATCLLKPNTTYFFALLYMKAKSGAAMTTPYVYYFTTGSDFSPYSINGTLSVGSTGVTLQDAVVGLMTIPIDKGQNEGPPPFAGWTNANSNGTFTIPYVPNGTYWPLAVKDVDHDGKIRPEDGVDVLAFGDSIVVNGASVNNVGLTFRTMAPNLFSDAVTIADSLDNDLPLDKVLRRASGWRVDTLGKSSSWEFVYTANSNTIGLTVNVSSFMSKKDTIDPNYFNWVINMRPLPNITAAASSATVVANVEAAGGKTFRTQAHPDSLTFKIEMSLADQNMSQYGNLVPDQSKFYWGVTYSWGVETPQQWFDYNAKYYLCDFTTGTVLASSTLSVQQTVAVPASFELFQNYPNPFNPSTTIEFTVRQTGRAVVKIYDVLGREVTTLFNDVAQAGQLHRVEFNASRLVSGIYFAKLQSGDKAQLKKMMLLK